MIEVHVDVRSVVILSVSRSLLDGQKGLERFWVCGEMEQQEPANMRSLFQCLPGFLWSFWPTLHGSRLRTCRFQCKGVFVGGVLQQVCEGSSTAACRSSGREAPACLLALELAQSFECWKWISDDCLSGLWKNKHKVSGRWLKTSNYTEIWLNNPAWKQQHLRSV